jgi:hypothetical protein
MSKETVLKVGEWVRQAGQILGVDADLSDDGVCTLLIGNNFTVAIEVPEEGNWFYLYTPIGELPKEDPDVGYLLLQKSLELNAFQAKTRGGAIGLVPGQPLLIYSMLRPIEGCDDQIFAETVALFYEAALEIQDILLNKNPS